MELLNRTIKVVLVTGAILAVYLVILLIAIPMLLADVASL